jgi:DnaK suppressor protein
MSKKQISSSKVGKKKAAQNARKISAKTKSSKPSSVAKKSLQVKSSKPSAVTKRKRQSPESASNDNKKISNRSKVLTKKREAKVIVSNIKSAAPKKALLPKPTSNSLAIKASKASKAKDNLLESSKLILKPTSQPKKIDELSAFHRKQLHKLEELRDHILDQMQNQEQITRQRAEGSEASAFGMHQADAGSDSYDRDFALSLLSQEQDALYEIEEAIKRIFYGTYGICEMSGKEIPKLRLEAIPYARFTVECQAQLEKENKGRRRWDSNPASFMESPDLVDQEGEGSNEDEETRRERE